jgi:LPS export ABC transporter protein LptC
MRRKTLLRILLVLILAVGSRWLLMQNQPVEINQGAEIDMRFDYVLSGFELRSYAAGGQLTALLQSPSLNQSAISLLGEIREPRLSIPGEGTGSVALRADQATVSADKNSISFSGGVSLQQAGGARGVTTVTTDGLTFNVATHTAHTDDKVHVVREGMQLTGIGLDADIRSQHYQLLSQVEGSYEQ